MWDKNNNQWKFRSNDGKHYKKLKWQNHAVDFNLKIQKKGKLSTDTWAMSLKS